jgi:hypothetical protein
MVRERDGWSHWDRRGELKAAERAEGFTDLQADALVSFLQFVDAAEWSEDGEPPPKNQAARVRRALAYWRLRARGP